MGGAAAYAYNVNMEIIRLTGKVFGQLFSGQRSVRDAGLAGPVGIVGVIHAVTIQAIISPEIWNTNGGPAAIRMWSGSLIVTAPRSVHEALAGYVD